MPHLITFGHGRLDRGELGGLVAGAGIAQVVDVRRFPGSRSNPAAARGQVEEWLAEIGVGYRWEERLGGRRRLTRAEDEASPDTWWEVAAFRAYAAWTRSADFRAAMDLLVSQSDSQIQAVMCSEAVWWRCHRRVIADVASLLHGLEVVHLMHDGSLRSHVPSAGARVDGDSLVWDLSRG
ncbi:DUF488 family protein [Actinomycetota bacterium]